jgi:hypothetical protein
MSAAAPPPQRRQVRLSILSRGFSELAAYDPVTVSSDALRELDAQTLELPHSRGGRRPSRVHSV